MVFPNSKIKAQMRARVKMMIKIRKKGYGLVLSYYTRFRAISILQELIKRHKLLLFVMEYLIR
jgi:hypothetical protein